MNFRLNGFEWRIINWRGKYRIQRKVSRCVAGELLKGFETQDWPEIEYESESGAAYALLLRFVRIDRKKLCKRKR